MNRLFALFGLLLVCSARPLCAADSSGAAAGRWTYDVPAARRLADSTDRPLLVMFSNTSGKCYWCDKFEKEINASKEWKIFANEQQLAMAFINFDGPNWDEAYYQSLASTNQTAITGFPAFVLYTSNGSNVLTSFSFNSTNLTFSSESFVSLLGSALEDGGYTLNGEDIWDPADDTAVGATILNFESFNQRQRHTLNDPSSTSDDLADWLKFLCVSGRKYKLQIPESDYTITYTPTGSTALTYTNANYNEQLPSGSASNSASYPATTNWVTTSSNTVVITASTNRFDNNDFLGLINGLPFFSQTAVNVIIRTSLTNLPPVITTNSMVVYTNLPHGNAQVVTNGSPTDVIVPSFSILDPTAQTPLTLDAGPLGYTDTLPLTALTNGCVFTPFASLNNAYCFIRINQPQTNSVGTFDTEVYEAPVTNLAIYTTTTNTAHTTVTQETVSNAWLAVTFTTNIFFDGYYDYVDVIINTNLISEIQVWTITNTTSEGWSHVTTNLYETTTTNYVHYAYGGTAYTLNYRLWEPGEVVFSPAAVSASESAASVKLTVTRRNGSAGAVRITYFCADDTAMDGEDYQAATGELVWADDQTGSTNITISLIQDLRPTWEGDERFSVTLQKSAKAEWFQARVGSASNAVVTLKESGGATKTGTLSFSGYGDDNTPFPNPSKPALTVTEGNTFTLCVARPGGNNGIAGVTVSTANGSAKAGTDYAPYTETLWWDNGECDPKPVSLPFTTLDRTPYNPDASFTVKLSGASGAKLGSPASVTVTIRDKAAAGGSLSDTAGAAAAVGAAFKASSANWFWSDEGRTTLRCEPLAQGGKAVLQLTLTGPGRLSFGWAMNDWADADTLTCSGGIVAGKELTGDGDWDSVLVKPGKQTITWTYTKAGAAEDEAYASLTDLVWEPLPKAATPYPANGARVDPGTLSWTEPAGTSVALGGDFAVGDGSLNLSCNAVAVSPKGIVLSNVIESVEFNELWSDKETAYNTTFKWRVDTVFSNDDGTLVNTGDTWSFTAIDAKENTGLPQNVDAEDGYAALQGVACDLGIISEADAGLTYAMIGGALPAGLKLTTSTGQISGVPTKAGTWTVTLQATSNVDGTRTPLNSATFTITVYPLGTFAGTYSGWTVPVSGDLAYSGAGSITVSGSGDLTAKFNVGGTAYSFSKKGFDGTDASTEPSYVEIDTCPGSSVTASNGKFVNTLDALTNNASGNLTATLTVYTLTKNGNGKTTATPTTHAVELFRNNWADANMKTLLAAFTGYYTVSLPVSTARDESASPLGSGYVTMTVSPSGNVKLSGVLADGNTWSSSTPLYLDPDQTNDTETAGKTAEVYLYAAPSSYAKNGGFCGRLRITAGDSPYGNVVECADLSGTLQWWNFTPTSVYGATGTIATASSGFLNAIAAAGGYYDTVMNLQTYYLNKTVTFADSTLESDPVTPAIDRIPSDYEGRNGASGYELLTGDDALPFDLALTVGAKSLSYASPADSSNTADLKLSLARATGLLSGSFLLTYERENADETVARHTRKAVLKGVYTPVRPGAWGDDPSAGVQGGGFYLIPQTSAYLNSTGRNVSYTFNWSYAFELNAE